MIDKTSENLSLPPREQLYQEMEMLDRQIWEAREERYAERNPDRKPMPFEPSRKLTVYKVEVTQRLSKLITYFGEKGDKVDPKFKGIYALSEASTIFDNNKFTKEQLESVRYALHMAQSAHGIWEGKEDELIRDIEWMLFVAKPKCGEKDFQKIGDGLQIFIDETKKINSREDLVNRLKEEKNKLTEQLPSGVFASKNKAEEIQGRIEKIDKAINSFKELDAEEEKSREKEVDKTTNDVEKLGTQK